MTNNPAKQPSSPHVISDPTLQTNNEDQAERFSRHKSPPPEGSSLPPPSQHTPILKKVVILLAIYLGIGTLCFHFTRDQMTGKKTDHGVLDALYFCIVTMTTVGYGDLVPNTVLTKLLASAFAISGMALVCLVLSKAVDYLAEKQQHLLVRALHMDQELGQRQILEDIKINKARFNCLVSFALMLLLLVAGIVVFLKVENMGFVDAIYCVCCSITTLGYGDKSFTTKPGRVFAVFWIVMSTLCLARFLVCVAEMNNERRQKELVKWALSRQMTRVDFEAADCNRDGVVRDVEIILYKLKEMGKINDEDISLLMKFYNGDVDQLAAFDGTLVQPSQTRN